ncbi:MAG: hypothetical protein AAFU61_08430 [Pseudomonadota bacterium]
MNARRRAAAAALFAGICAAAASPASALPVTVFGALSSATFDADPGPGVVPVVGEVAFTATADTDDLTDVSTLATIFPGLPLRTLTPSLGGIALPTLALDPGDAFVITDGRDLGLAFDLPGDGTSVPVAVASTSSNGLGDLLPAGFLFDASVPLTPASIAITNDLIDTPLSSLSPGLAAFDVALLDFGAPTSSFALGPGAFSVTLEEGGAEVPLPAALPLALGAFGGLAWLARRRRA